MRQKRRDVLKGESKALRIKRRADYNPSVAYAPAPFTQGSLCGLAEKKVAPDVTGNRAGAYGMRPYRSVRHKICELTPSLLGKAWLNIVRNKGKVLRGTGRADYNPSVAYAPAPFTQGSLCGLTEKR